MAESTGHYAKGDRDWVVPAKGSGWLDPIGRPDPGHPWPQWRDPDSPDHGWLRSGRLPPTATLYY